MCGLGIVDVSVLDYVIIVDVSVLDYVIIVDVSVLDYVIPSARGVTIRVHERLQMN